MWSIKCLHELYCLFNNVIFVVFCINLRKKKGSSEWDGKVLFNNVIFAVFCYPYFGWMLLWFLLYEEVRLVWESWIGLGLTTMWCIQCRSTVNYCLFCHFFMHALCEFEILLILIVLANYRWLHYFRWFYLIICRTLATETSITEKGPCIWYHVNNQ